MTFDKIFSQPGIISFLQEHKLTNPTSIQQQVMPDFIQGKSVNVIAKTGSGKTYCFVLPISELLKISEENRGASRDPKADHGKPKAVILAPTRELALQLQKVFKSVSHHVKLRVRMLAGGDAAKNNHLLSRDNIDILIASPGRLSNALKRKELNLKETKYLIMDEADQLLEMGFRKDLENIYTSCDPSLVHVGLFSATHSTSLDEFCKTIFSEIDFQSYNPEEKNKLTQTVRTFNIYVKDNEKMKMAEAFLKNEAKGRGIIFVNKHDAVSTLLTELQPKFSRFKFHALHGEMEAKARKKAYDQFLKEGGILISTDITARGMDIDDLMWVMNFDLPFEAVYYIHRCGRVGRRQTDGFVYNLVTPKDVNIVSRINESIKNQTALKLTSFDEKKFAAIKAKAKPIETKIEKKKKQLETLKKKVFTKKKPGDKKHLKVVKATSTPRYKRTGAPVGKKKTSTTRGASNGATRGTSSGVTRGASKGAARGTSRGASKGATRGPSKGSSKGSRR
jgi:superfamily II DNA/RNA helicase